MTVKMFESNTESPIGFFIDCYENQNVERFLKKTFDDTCGQQNAIEKNDSGDIYYFYKNENIKKSEKDEIKKGALLIKDYGSFDIIEEHDDYYFVQYTYAWSFRDFLHNKIHLEKDKSIRILRDIRRRRIDKGLKEDYYEDVIMAISGLLKKPIKFDLLKTDIETCLKEIAISTNAIFGEKFPQNHFWKGLQRLLKEKEHNYNTTRFKLKNVSPRVISIFYDNMIQKRLIDSNTHEIQIEKFLNGETPDKKINWIREERHLKYFIEKYCDKKANRTEVYNGQPYKYCLSIFKINGEELSKDWNRNFNKLKNRDDIDTIKRVLSFLDR